MSAARTHYSPTELGSVTHNEQTVAGDVLQRSAVKTQKAKTSGPLHSSVTTLMEESLHEATRWVREQGGWGGGGGVLDWLVRLG